MTKDQLRTKLITDPNFIYSYIYANNPDAVIERMRSLGFVLNNADDVFTAINQLLERGDTVHLQEAFSVPILTDQMDPSEIAVVQDVISAQAQAQSGGPLKKLSFDNLSWASIGGLATGLITALAGGTPGGAQVQQTNTQTPPPAPEKKSNTIAIVAIAGGALLAVVVVILAMRRNG